MYTSTSGGRACDASPLTRAPTTTFHCPASAHATAPDGQRKAHELPYYTLVFESVLPKEEVLYVFFTTITL